jgi:phosphoenolpyruvate---glycerone phosphotransferase subunit DhaL
MSTAVPVDPLLPRIIDEAAGAIRANAERLSELDRAIGDGDHGVNMLRGFSAVAEARAAIAALPLASALEEIGKLLVLNVGGASGPLYGSFFMAMGRSGSLDGRASLREMFAAGVAAVKKRGKSERGEKTMLDVLVPVQLAWDQANTEGLDARALIERLTGAADAGLESTRPLLATKGRASFLRERSVGHLDPGACSSSLLVHAASKAFLEVSHP